MPLKAGTRHTLVVRADWRGPAAMKADGWHRLWFNFGGINRGVSIRRIGASEISYPEMQHEARRRRGGGRPQDPPAQQRRRRARSARRAR